MNDPEFNTGSGHKYVKGRYQNMQDMQDNQDNKAMGVLAYLGILVLIPIFAAKDSPFARYHANQGLVLCIAEIICGMIAGIPFIGWIVGGVGGVVTFVLMIIGIVNAAKGEMKPLPLIGGISILK